MLRAYRLALVLVRLKTNINKNFHPSPFRLLPETGFTLVELIMGLVTSSIVLVGLFVIVSGSHEYTIDNRKKIRLQQNFSLVRNVVAANVRQGIYNKRKIYANYAGYQASQSPQTTGSCMKLYFPAGDSILLYQANNDFKIEQSGGSITSLVVGVIDSLVFTKKNRYIQTQLTMSNGNHSMADTLRHAFINYTFTEYDTTK